MLTNGNTNTNLNAAKKAKNDEFYTQLKDIDTEVDRYAESLAGLVVYCNTDDYRRSNFVRYFVDNFERFKLRGLIASHYNPIGGGVAVKYWGGAGSYEEALEMMEVIQFQGDGDFRSDESIALLKESDIIVTNPPFSLFRDYISQLITYNKSFLVIGSMNAITYKEIFPLLQENKVWLGHHSGAIEFIVPPSSSLRPNAYVDSNGEVRQKFGNIIWYTNLDHARRHEEIPLFREYNPEDYPTYDNYDAIEVSRVANIPVDYDGVMGVPITFLGKHNPDQFEIVRFRYGDDNKDLKVNGKSPYFRILIRRKQQG